MSEYYERQRAIRAVVAAQWAVAISLFSWPGLEGSESPHAVALDLRMKECVWRLPCAVDLVDGL